MIIKELHLKNFGKFSGESFQFSDGINVIYGPNEAGKTTVYHAICAMLFGLDKQRGRAAKSDTYTTYQPWENRTWYEGSLKFETGRKIFCLERSFYHNEKTAHLFCETDGEELSVKDGDLNMILGEVCANLYYNTAAVGQLRMKPQDIVYSYLKNHIASVHEAGKNATDVVKALSILENKKKALEKEKKQQTDRIFKQLESLDVRIGLVDKEIENCIKQLENLKSRKELMTETEIQEERKGFWRKIFCWLKKIFYRKRLQEEAQQKRENILKLKEKIKFLQEFLGEKECQKEEFLLEKDSFYEKLHEKSKDDEIRALELAMERIRALSALGEEGVLKQLLRKTSGVLSQITDGKYQKLIFDENMEPLVWDGSRTVKLFQLSTGCVDQVYLALRIGLQDLFFEEETLPLLFDDAFVYFDDKRLESLLTYLYELGRQVLIFSCHEREIRILEKHQISYGKILL